MLSMCHGVPELARSLLSKSLRSSSFFADSRFREATRLIELKLHLSPMEHLTVREWPNLGLLHPDSSFPPLHFTGSSRGISGTEAKIEGFVRMGRDGVPRWQFVSIYDGRPQWSSEGVQIGNVGSAAGIVGCWTASQHDPGDPVGPFWLWKVEDNYPAALVEYT